jgi:hypothetical protein
LLARQAELEAELTVACTNYYRTVLLWEVSHTGIEAQVAIVPQGLGQLQKLKNGHHVWYVRRGMGQLRGSNPLDGRQAKLTSFLETFSCRDLSCRCCSLVTRIHPRSISETVYSGDKGGRWGLPVSGSRKCLQLALSSLTLSHT